MVMPALSFSFRPLEVLAPDAAPARLDLLTDTIWVLAGPAVYVDLVHRRHWSSAQYATWLTGQLQYAAQLARHPGEGDRSDVSA
jgi:hypothetical protein